MTDPFTAWEEDRKMPEPMSKSAGDDDVELDSPNRIFPSEPKAMSERERIDFRLTRALDTTRCIIERRVWNLLLDVVEARLAEARAEERKRCAAHAERILRETNFAVSREEMAKLIARDIEALE